MQIISGICSQNGTGDPVINQFQVDLSEFTYTRHETGNYRIKSPDFNENTKVLISNALNTGKTVAHSITHGDSITGYVLQRYMYEDGEGIIEQQTFDASWNPADGILNNFPIFIPFKQNPQQ